MSLGNKTWLAAVVQMDSQTDKMHNLRMIEELIDQAVAGGADFISFPEDVNLVGKNTGQGGGPEAVPGLTSSLFSRKAKEHGVYILGGSFHKAIEGEGRVYNHLMFFGPDGEVISEYDKIHMFDLVLPDGTFVQESKRVKPGQTKVVCETPLGAFGMSICFDLRFPELYKDLTKAGAQILIVSSDFTKPTGIKHWEILLRARAIENGCYVIAANQTGKKPAYEAYGNSMIIDPDGRILARAGEETEIIYAEIDLSQVKKCQAKLPWLQEQ